MTKTKSITPQELRKRLQKKEVVLIDVREPFEHKAEYIENAISIPLQQVGSDALVGTSKPIVLHCNSGLRSDNACRKLLAENPQLDIYVLTGGIKGWKAAGFEVRQSSSHVLPLDRQVQITVGSFITLGMLLGTFVNHWFYVIPTFFGLGLCFAGLTGWCGMALLLSKMPWNR